MSLIKKSGESFGTRLLVVMGSKASGKTTFAVTGSKHAPEKLPVSPRVECSDTLILQYDLNGVLGPHAVGLEPHVIDMSHVGSVSEADKLFNEAIKEIRPLFAERKYSILGIDLSALDKLWRDQFVIQSEFDGPKAWESVTAKALAYYRLLRTVPNATIIAMSHVNVPAEIASKQDPSVLLRQQEARNAVSVGGERSTITADLAKGFKNIFWANADAVMFMRRKRVSEGKYEHVVRIQSSSKVEAGGRLSSILKDEEPAHLRTILRKAYGDAI